MSQLKITVNEVERVARLARLAPSPAQAEALAKDLSAILSYVQQLSEVDTQEVSATAHVAQQAIPYREDKCSDGLTQEDALRSAPSAHDGGFAVPKVLEVDA